MTWSSYLFDWLCGAAPAWQCYYCCWPAKKHEDDKVIYQNRLISLNSVVSYYSYSHVTHIGFPYLTNDFFYTKAQHRSFIIFF